MVPISLVPTSGTVTSMRTMMLSLRYTLKSSPLPWLNHSPSTFTLKWLEAPSANCTEEILSPLELRLYTVSVLVVLGTVDTMVSKAMVSAENSRWADAF